MEWVWMIVGIVAITTAGDLVGKWLKLRTKELESQPSQARIEKLEARIETLERLATDDRQQLRNSIDAL